MLHFALETGGSDPITDDQGVSGTSIFDGTLFDGTAGGEGDSEDVLLYLYNDDSNYEYNSPTITIVITDETVQASWFTLLDNQYVVGVSPTEREWATYGVPGNLPLTLAGVGAAGSLNPQVLFWIRCSVPAGTAVANFTDVKVRVNATEIAV